MEQTGMYSKEYYVYAHYTQDKNTLFYIGKGKKNRAYVQNKRSKLWKNIVKKHGFFVKILHSNLTESEAFKKEIKEIKKHSPKANLTPGGEGFTGKAHANSIKGIKNYWKNMDPIKKSKEQSRRAKLRKTKGIICLNNNKYYKTAKKAAEELNIKYQQHITRVANGSRKSCYNYKFKYAT